VLRSKKGISPILATLLLIVIAVAAVIVTYAWVITFTSTQTTTVGKMIKFDSAVVNATSPDLVTVYVRNWGTEYVTLDKVYIDGNDYSTYATFSVTSLKPEAVSKMTLNGTAAGLNFVAGNYYKVKVAGSGVSWEESVKAS